MVDRPEQTAKRKLCKVVGALLLAASAAGCDKCGDLIRLHSGQQEVCRDQSPQPR